MFTQGCRLRSNPGLELANAFGVSDIAVVVEALLELATPSALVILRSLLKPRRELANAFGISDIAVVVEALLELANAFGVSDIAVVVEASAGISQRLRR